MDSPTPIPDRRCYYDGCVATWRHRHGFLPGGYDDPGDPTGVPILFTDDDPEPGALRDFHGAKLEG